MYRLVRRPQPYYHSTLFRSTRGRHTANRRIGNLDHSSAVGNQTMQSLAHIQPKLESNTAGDAHEREADLIANRVMSMPGPLFQRKESCLCGGRCPTCKTQSSAQSRSLTQNKVQPTQISASPSPASQPLEMDSEFGGTLSASKGKGQPLDVSTRSFMEHHFGTDFSRVRIHTDLSAGDMCQSLRARAFTNGTDVYFSQGQYHPHDAASKRILSHELTHVVQQSGMAHTIQRYDWGMHDVPGMAEWAERRHQRSPRRDITVVDWGENWNGFNIAAGLFHIGEIDVSSVENMVVQIENCLQEGDCIRTLTIIGHGSPGQIAVGDGTGRIAGRYIGGGTLDPTSPAYRPDMVATLARLTPRFCDGAQVILRGCDVGNGDLGEMFVQRLVALWGVSVKAHVGTIRGGGHWTTGEWTEGEPARATP